MSHHFDKKKGLYVVRSYSRRVYTYIGQCATVEEAKEMERKWYEEKQGSFVHSSKWFEEESRRQLAELPKKYPGFVNGKPGKLPRLSNA